MFTFDLFEKLYLGSFTRMTIKWIACKVS